MAFAGVLGVALAGAWFGWVGATRLAAGQDFRHTIATQRAVMAGPALLIAVGVIFLAERRWPAVRRPMLTRAHVVDAGYLALFAVVVAPLVVLVDTGFAVDAQRHASFLILGRLPVLPRALVVVVVLVAMDLANWLAHGASHRFGALWRLHAMHHSQEDMSVFTTFRTHPLVHASYLPALVPALVLGASGPVPTDALVAYACFVALAHANLPWTFGPLRSVVVSPAYHRLHHASSAIDERGTVNFGFVLVCWDQLAQRALLPSARFPVPTGIAGRPVPVEQTAGPFRTLGVMTAQLSQPFERRPSIDGPS